MIMMLIINEIKMAIVTNMFIIFIVIVVAVVVAVIIIINFTYYLFNKYLPLLMNQEYLKKKNHLKNYCEPLSHRVSILLFISANMDININFNFSFNFINFNLFMLIESLMIGGGFFEGITFIFSHC